MKVELVRPQVPASSRKPCARPVEIPDRDINQAETTTLWDRDRAELLKCEPRRAAAVAAVDGAVP